MAIVKIGNSILTTPCEKLTEDNYSKHLSKFLMRSIPYRKYGVGLASNQVNLPYRICSVKIGEIWKTFINPTIPKVGAIFRNAKIIDSEEGCLSIPNKRYTVKRRDGIDLIYADTNFTLKHEKFSGLTAIVIQHELDHLDGVLISMKNN
jgi:peptide deformylase